MLGTTTTRMTTMPREMTLDELVRVDRVTCWDYSDRQGILGTPGQNLVTVETPQLRNLRAGATAKVSCHKLVAPMFKRFLELCEQTGRLKYLLTYEGCYSPRNTRGSSSLSTHAWGAAFDFNYQWNMLERTPAKEGSTGSLIPVVGIAQACGFAWGGHYRRPDGMHFEPFEIRGPDKLPVLVDHPKPEVSASEAQRLAYRNLMHEHLKGLYTAVPDVLGDEDAQMVLASLNGINRILVQAGVKDG